MRVLVIDVEGTHVKGLVTIHKKPVRILSSLIMTAVKMVEAVRAAIVTWEYSAASIGYPGSVVQGHPIIEPYHLGRG